MKKAVFPGSAPRRSFFTLGLLILGLLAPAPASGKSEAFGFEEVTAIARDLAGRPYREPEKKVPDWLLQIRYDQWRDIRFRPARALWRQEKLPFEVQFFHPGMLYDRPVRINVVAPGGVEPVAFSPELFDYGKNGFGPRIPRDLGFAGFRIHAPFRTAAYYDEVAAFLGASYFRAVGKEQTYGLSARGLAVDTAAPTGEEFPYFTEFWLQKPRPGDKTLTVYALLDSPSLAGAYRFVIRPGDSTEMDVESVLFRRREGSRLGVAPLTSMFFYGESGARRPPDDFRPEVHDSDGLLIAFAGGERLWRPLCNPRLLSVNSFQAPGVKGFGLLQRDRDFDHYLDLETRAETRPSVWITPQGDWGAGRVELVEIPAGTEGHDNIVAYWVPQEEPPAGEPLRFAYTMGWHLSDGARTPGGRVTATRIAGGTKEGERLILVDFEGESLRTLPPAAAVEGVVDVGEGAALTERRVERVPATGGVRLTFVLRTEEVGPLEKVLPDKKKPVELRAFLRGGDGVLTETWSYALKP